MGLLPSKQAVLEWMQSHIPNLITLQKIKVLKKTFFQEKYMYHTNLETSKKMQETYKNFVLKNYQS